MVFIAADEIAISASASDTYKHRLLAYCLHVLRAAIVYSFEHAQLHSGLVFDLVPGHHEGRR